jgi:hypothetical protein
MRKKAGMPVRQQGDPTGFLRFQVQVRIRQHIPGAADCNMSFHCFAEDAGVLS